MGLGVMPLDAACQSDSITGLGSIVGLLDAKIWSTT